MQIDYNSAIAVGTASGPETILYATYTTGTGVVAGVTRGSGGTTAVSHANLAAVQCGDSSVYYGALSALYDGWITANEVWTRTGDGTFTVPGDFTGVYSVGDKIRTTGYKYFYITSLSFGGGITTINITGGTDYVLATSPATRWYSKSSNPVGFPTEVTTGTNTTLRMQGKTATIRHWGYLVYASANNTTTASPAYGITFASIPNVQATVIGKDSGLGTTLASIDAGVDCALDIINNSASALASLIIIKGGTVETAIVNGHTYFYDILVTGTI